MDITTDNELVTEDIEPTQEVFYSIVRDEVIHGFCKTRERAIAVMNELSEKDMLNAPTNEMYRRVYDDDKLTLKIYTQIWTMAIFPYERVEHYYFISPIKHIE